MSLDADWLYREADKDGDACLYRRGNAPFLRMSFWYSTSGGVGDLLHVFLTKRPEYNGIPCVAVHVHNDYWSINKV